MCLKLFLLEFSVFQNFSKRGKKYQKYLQPLTPLTKPQNYMQGIKSKGSSKQATKPYSVSHEGVSRMCIDAIERNCKHLMLTLTQNASSMGRGSDDGVRK